MGAFCGPPGPWAGPAAILRVASAVETGSQRAQPAWVRGSTARNARKGRPTTAGKRQKKKKAAGASSGEKLIAQNRKARHQYFVLDTLECGIVLVGSEVKSLRAGRVSLDEAYGRIRNGEVWLVGCDIPIYADANRFNHEPRRPRKLLLHRREIHRFASRAYEKGLTLVPLKLYFRNGLAKVLMGVCRGKQKHDKRETMKKAEARRQIQAAMRRR